MSDELTIHVVYHNPSDYPGKWVVRRHFVGVDGVNLASEPDCVADSLAEARDHIPVGLFRMNRHPHDPEVIYETWL